MSLVHAADRKRFHNSFVRSLAGRRVFRVERTFMLIDHNAVFMQGLIAASVEFPRKQAFSRAKRICGIHNDQIIGVFAGADETDTVFIVNIQALVIKPACRLAGDTFCTLPLPEDQFPPCQSVQSPGNGPSSRMTPPSPAPMTRTFFTSG